MAIERGCERERERERERRRKGERKISIQSGIVWGILGRNARYVDI